MPPQRSSKKTAQHAESQAMPAGRKVAGDQPAAVPRGLDLSEAAGRRLARKRAEVSERERREPLRRRILETLARGEVTSSVLSDRVAAAPATVSRQLRKLREAGLVESRGVLGDGRMREYFLSTNGEIELSQHRAFGVPESPPAEPTDVQVSRFLQSALSTAVKIRRKTNRLDDASARLGLIVEQARKAKAQALTIEALAELATTLRQDRAFDAVGDLLGDLERIALGHDRSMTAAMALPAAAHREYALGRLPSNDVSPGVRFEHLLSARNLYRQLAETPPCGTSREWRGRQAWSVVSAANHLRSCSQFEAALGLSVEALLLFEEIEDDYGRSRCLFMLGFCLRLVGDFDDAWSYLEDAHRLASEHSFERFQADSLMQMGEVRRCQGQVDDAREMLDESLQRAQYMNLTVTEAFAQSARGALDYQEYRFVDAEKGLLRAHNLFAGCDHLKGLALNARRRAAVARRAAVIEAGERDEAVRLVGEALGRYEDLHSPAGVTACEIEFGRLEIMRQGHASGVVNRLIERLDDPAQRDLLEFDPWVPRVVGVFAEEAGEDDPGLHDRAVRLLAAAQLRAQEARDGAKFAFVKIRHASRRVVGHWQAEPIIDEMGGETRFRDDGIEAPQPICF